YLWGKQLGFFRGGADFEIAQSGQALLAQPGGNGIVDPKIGFQFHQHFNQPAVGGNSHIVDTAHGHTPVVDHSVLLQSLYRDIEIGGVYFCVLKPEGCLEPDNCTGYERQANQSKQADFEWTNRSGQLVSPS